MLKCDVCQEISKTLVLSDSPIKAQIEDKLALAVI